MSSCNCIARELYWSSDAWGQALTPADQTFSGSLLSTVTCSSCAHASSTVDPIMSLQLDFAPSDINASTSAAGAGTHSSAASAISSSSSTNGDAIGGVDTLVAQQGDGITLGSMLRRFCADETIGDTAKGWACEGCGGGPGVVCPVVS